MKGTAKILAIYQGQASGPAVVAIVAKGSLQAGMESVAPKDIILSIKLLLSQDLSILEQVHSSQQAVIIVFTAASALLLDQLVGQSVEFDDRQSIKRMDTALEPSTI